MILRHTILCYAIFYYIILYYIILCHNILHHDSSIEMNYMIWERKVSEGRKNNLWIR